MHALFAFVFTYLSSIPQKPSARKCNIGVDTVFQNSEGNKALSECVLVKSRQDAIHADDCLFRSSAINSLV